MVASKIIALVLCAFLINCESAFVDSLFKCGKNDGECHKKLLQTLLPDIAKTGIPEIGISPFDPYKVTNVEFNILNVVNMTMEDGIVRGIKDCVVNNFKTNMDIRRAMLEITCDILIKGRYKVFSNSPMIKTLLSGETIHGEGLAKMKLEKLNIKFEYFFDIVKRDGDIYIKCNPNKTIHEENMEGMIINFDNLYLGKEEHSATIVKLINENWRFIMSTFGKSFFDKAVEILFGEAHKFFDYTPTKYYIIDDLENLL